MPFGRILININTFITVEKLLRADEVLLIRR